MKIKEVVFPVDFSERSVEVSPYVAALTRRLGAKLTLLHVVERLPPGSTPLDRLYTGDEAALDQRKDAANDALAAFQTQYIPHLPSQLCVMVGDPAKCIVGYGGESKGRMIIMPTHGFGPFRQMLLGSVTAKVLHDARCPVLTSPHLEKAIHPKRWLRLERIICALSLDWETDNLVKDSAELAEQFGSRLMATHVITPVEEGLLPLMDPGGPPISTRSIESAMGDALDRAGVAAEIRVLVGEPSRRVACAAKEYDADLIVIGRGGSPELPGGLGTHGYAIVRRAPCPVLCVPTN